ncbi:MAG TPA: MBL fold metallo-hydrolase [Ilumatobacteraceae bacterium]|nr:MBL fold metallo-hydrolase [Ilumatobacteraceae bacterium]
MLVGPETFLIPNLAAGGDGTYVPVNSLLIRGSEPIVVDTGAPIHRAHWLDMVFSLVDPEDIRWIFLSHDDGDHTGSLHEVLAAAPNATLITNFFSTERLGLERPVPMHRSIWREPGDTFRAGDRTLRLFLPPIFDGPTTRGLYDESTGVMWIVDSFAALTTGAVHHVEDLPTDLYDESFMLFNSLVSPWHQWLDPAVYSRHTSVVEALNPQTVASAHGPILTGSAIHDAFDRVRTLAGQPRLMAPGQELLDEILATAIAP